MLIKKENRIIAADGYKYSHPAQYPFGANNQYDYGEARSNKRFSKTLVNGLQGLMNVYWTTPISNLEIGVVQYTFIKPCKPFTSVLLNLLLLLASP